MKKYGDHAKSICSCVLMTTVNEPLQLDIWYLVRKQVLNLWLLYILNILCKLQITNMTTFESLRLYNKFNTYRVSV
jgi:hypothetical protein